MPVDPMSRRGLLTTGAAVLIASSIIEAPSSAIARQNNAVAKPRGASMNEDLIRTYYHGYEKKDWNLSDGVLADNFTFTSPNGDDHISKSVFKEKCFLSQMGFIKRFDFESILARGDEAFVKYLCRTTKGTFFRNTEYFRFADGKITAIECYFGGNLGYPSAAASGGR
jgi:ketosteroid isomerase-like protein